MQRIFISYSRKDIDFVRRLAGDLENAGHEVWWDLSDLRGSDDWARVVPAALEASDTFLVVLSPNSATSEWVEKESTWAFALRKKIIPILLEHSDIPFALATVNYVDFTSPDYAANLKTLLTALGYSGEAPTPLGMPASPLASTATILIGVVLVLALLATFLFQQNLPSPATALPVSSLPVVVPSTATVTETPVPTDTAPAGDPTSTPAPDTPTRTITATQRVPILLIGCAEARSIVRTGPGTGYSPLGEPILAGECVGLSARNEDGTWLQVAPHQPDPALERYAGGWIFRELLLFVPPPPSIPDSLPVVTLTLSPTTTLSGPTITAEAHTTPTATLALATPNATQTILAAFLQVTEQYPEIKSNLVYIAPRTMRLNQTIPIELHLNPSMSAAQLATLIVTESGLPTSAAAPGQLEPEPGQQVGVEPGEVIITDRMKAVLKSLKLGAFDIVELHDNAEQPISSVDTTKWRWSVTARERGEQAMELTIFRLVKDKNNNEHWLEVEAYTASIVVNVTVGQWFGSLDWKWILGILVTALLIPLFFRWYDARRKEAEEQKRPKPPKRKSRKT